MKKFHTVIWIVLSLAAINSIALAQTLSDPTVPVTIDNYNRAQSDVYFALIAKGGGFGKFRHGRDLAPIGQGGIIRPNRDTLYSLAVFDLDAGPVTITLPDPGKRFLTMQAINEDQYTQPVYYGAGSHTLTREMMGTRYAGVAVRVLVDPRDKNELQQIHSLQDAIKVAQQNPGTFQIPNWDEASRKEVQAALLQLGTTISDTRRMYGANESQVDPVRHVIGSAMLWGGAPEKDALYLPITPERNDGMTIYKLIVRGGPVHGFWSLTVYNREGHIEPNKYDAYSVNSYTAVKGPDGSVAVQFGGCNGKIPNCLPIMSGWNYTVRLFRPRPEILDGRWKFPLALPERLP
ncbi:MAG TPA: DUF1254 domain-containing protein [Pyrinomonadaceae bacterium]|nr:DUF1254 domain-containing protein [Pyrinomonadaceae bacterium]